MRESAFVRFRLLAVLILAAAMVAAGVLLSGALTARAAEEPTALTLAAAQTDGGAAKFYTLTTLDDAKDKLELTGTYPDGERPVTDYELTADCGSELTSGEVTLTAALPGGGLSATLTVEVVDEAAASIKAELAEGAVVTDSMTTADVAELLVVTAYSAGGDVMGTIPSDEIELSGSLTLGSSSMSEVKTFTVRYGNLSTTAEITVHRNVIEKIEVVGFDYTGDIYSYTAASTVNGYLDVQATRTDGSTERLDSNQYSIVGAFTPDNTYDGSAATFSKAMTVRHTYSVGGVSYNVDTKYEFDGIKAATPLFIYITSNRTSYNAYDKFTPSDFAVTVMYSGGRNPVEITNYTIEYGDASGEPVEGAEGYVYDNGQGTIIVSYTENGETVESYSDPFQVNKLAATPVTFNPASGEYDYSVDGGTATDEAQTVNIGNYDPEIMKIVSVSDGGAFDSEAGTITVTDAGIYEVVVELTNPAYYWTGQADDETQITITYEVTKAPLRYLAAGFEVNGESATEWDYSETAVVTLDGNYGGAQPTYSFGGQSDDGTFEPYTTSDPTDVPTLAGDYTLTVTVPESDNFLGGTTASVSFRIGRRTISAPTIQTLLTYNGTAQTPTIEYVNADDANYLIVKCEEHKDAGDYTVTFTLSDPDNVTWADDAGAVGNTLTLEYRIGRLAIKRPGLVTSESSYVPGGQSRTMTDFNKTASGGDFDGAITLSSDTFDDITGATLTATDAGTYTVTVSLSDTANLMWVGGTHDKPLTDSFTLSWTVTPARLEVPTVTGGTYDGSVINAGYTADGRITVSGETSGTDAGEYAIVFALADTHNYAWTDGTTDAQTVTWTIEQASIAAPSQSNSLTYNESEQSAEFSDGLAGTAYTVLGGSATNAGEHTATLTLITGSKGLTNYKWSDSDGSLGDASREVTWKIAPKQVTDAPTAENSVYSPDGVSGELTGFVAADSVGTVMTATAEGGATADGGKLSAINANEDGYVVRVTLSDNYVWADGLGADGQTLSIEWVVERLAVETPTVTGTYIYNGGEQSVALSGERDVAYTAAGEISATNAGEYTVTVTPTSNYKWMDGSDGARDVKWSIARLAVERPEKLTFVGGNGDGNTYNYGSAVTAAPVGDIVGFTVGGETTATVVKTDGDYVVTFTLDDNHCWATAEDGETVYVHTLEWNVLPLAVTAPTAPAQTTATYNGEAHEFVFVGWNAGKNNVKPYEFSVTAEYDYTAGADGKLTVTDAGTYRVSVTLTDTVNFVWSGGGTEAAFVCDVTIDPLAVSVTEWSGAENLVYSGEAQKPVVGSSNVSGDVTFVYEYTDAAGTAEPTDAGSYTAEVAGLTGADAHNYTLDGATGLSVTFEIAKYTIKTAEAVVFADRYIEYTGEVLTPDVTLTQPLGENVLTWAVDEDSESATEYGTYWIVVKLSDTDNFAWEISENYNDSNPDAADRFGESDGFVEMWFQITRTRLTAEDVDLTANSVEYGSALEISYNEDIPGGGKVTVLYYGTPISGAFGADNWTATDRDSATDTVPTLAGEYTVVLVVEQGGSYERGEFTASFSVTQKKIKLTFGEQDGYKTTYGKRVEATATADGLVSGDDAGITLTYSSDGGYSSADAPLHAGNYTVTATITNANYTLGGETFTVPFVIEKAQLTVTVNSEKITYGDSAPAYILVYDGFVSADGVSAADDESVVSGAPAYSYTFGGKAAEYEAGSDVGTYNVTAAGLQADDYYFVYSYEGTLTVSPRTIVLTVTGEDKTYDGKAASVTVSADNRFGDDEIVYDYSYSHGESSAVNAGSYRVTVTLGTGGKTGNYVLGAAGYSDGFKIAKRTLTVKFAGEYEIEYGGTSPAFALDYDGWADGESKTALGVSEIFTVTRDGANYAPGADYGSVGIYDVTATISGTLDNYAINDGSGFTVATTMEVAPRELTLTVTADGKTYDGEAVTVSVTPDRALSGDEIVFAFAYTVGGEADGSLSGASAAVNAGSYRVTVTLGAGGETGNYVLADPDGYSAEFVIDKAELTVAAVVAEGEYIYGNALTEGYATPSVTGWAKDDDTGLLTVTGFTVTRNGANYEPGAEHGSVGDYVVTPIASVSELANYEIKIETDVLTISPRPVTVTLGDIGSVYGEAPKNLMTAASASGLADGLEKLGDIIKLVALSGESEIGLTSLTGVGEYSIAGNATDDNYSVTFNGTHGARSIYTVSPAAMSGASFDPYSGIYDGNEHTALTAAPTITTVNEMKATWYFRVSGGNWTEGYANVEFRDAGSYTVYYYVKADNHELYGSDSTEDGAEGLLSFTVTIDKFELTVSADGETVYGEEFGKGDYTVTYNGNAAFPNGDTAAEQGVEFSVTSDYEKGDNVAVYTITLSGATETKNYVITYESGKLNVIKRSVTVTINDNTGSTYGNPFNSLTAYVSHGSLYAPDGEWSDVVSLTVCGADGKRYDTEEAQRAAEAGEYFIVGSVTNGNYDITFVGSQDYDGGTKNAGKYTVSPRNVTIQTVVVNGGSWTYDGTRKGYEVDEYTVEGATAQLTFEYTYEGTDGTEYSASATENGGEAARPTDAGSYKVTITANNENYTVTGVSLTFKIEKADYAATGMSGGELIADGDDEWEEHTSARLDGKLYDLFVYRYDGTAHRPTVDESLFASGADGTTPRVASVTEGKTNVRDGGEQVTNEYYVREITFTFAAGSDNYNAPEELTVLVAVVPLTVEVDWGDESAFVYNGEDQSGSIVPTYKDVNGETVELDKAFAAAGGETPREFVDAGLYKYVADFKDGDNVYGNYELRAGDDTDESTITNVDRQLFRILPREISITAQGGSMSYGDDAPAPSTNWSYDESSLKLIESDGIVVTVTARTENDEEAEAVASDTHAGSYYNVISVTGERAVNYSFKLTSGTFEVTRRKIEVKISDAGSVYGGEQAELTAALSGDARLSAANAELGPNGETLASLVTLDAGGGITTRTPVGKYKITGSPAQTDDYEITYVGSLGDGGEYTVSPATFTEDDFAFSGYSGIYDGEAHSALASFAPSGEAAAFVNELTLTVYVARGEGGAEGGTPMSETFVTNVAESGTYRFYVVATTEDGVECYERAAFTFTVEISADVNELERQFSWSGLEYGRDIPAGPADAVAKYGDAKIEGIYKENGERVADSVEAFAEAFPDGGIGAGNYYAKVTVEAGVYGGVENYAAAEFECGFTVAKHVVTLSWSLGHSLVYDGEAKVNTLTRSGDEWLTGAFSEYFSLVSSSTGSGSSGTDGATGYPVLTATLAGTYSFTVSLSDADNYVWASGLPYASVSGTECVFTFGISAQANSITIGVAQTDGGAGWTYGDTDGKDFGDLVGRVADLSAPSDKLIYFTVTAESSYTYAFTSVDGGGYSSSALPTDAGRYKVTVTVAGTDAYGSVTGEAEFTIFPAVMAAPTLGSATTEYTGGEQTNTVVGYVGGVMTISGSVTMNGSEVLMTATGAGEYSVSVTLESANYVWSDDLPDYVDGSGRTLTLVWTVEKGVPVFEGTITAGGGTYGNVTEPSGVTAALAGGYGLEVVYEYFTLSGGVYSSVGEAAPTDAGEYYVAAKVVGTDDVEEAYLTDDGARVYAEFTISAADGSEVFAGASVEAGGTYGGAVDVKVTGAGDAYKVAYRGTTNGGEPYESDEAPTQAGSYYAVVTIEATDNWTEYTFETPFTVERASFTATVTVDSVTFGEAVAPSVSSNPGGAEVKYLYSGRTNGGETLTDSEEVPTHAGSYTVRAVIAQSDNYTVVTTRPVSFTIERAMIGSVLTVSMTGFTYGGDSAPVIEGNLGGGSVTYVYSGALNGGQAYYEEGADEEAIRPTDAGYYRLTISVATTDDYYGDTATTTFYIYRADLSITAAIDGWTYGSESSVPSFTAFGGLPDGAGTVYYYYFGSSYDGSWNYEYADRNLVAPTLAGEYKMIAVVAQTDNYKRAESAEAEFAIAKADYAAAEFDMSGWTENGGVYYVVYDGNAHSPVLAALPVGLDGAEVAVEYSGSVTNVADGEVTVTARLSSDSSNYNAPGEVTVVVAVSPRAAEAVWTTEYVYNGKAQTPTAYYAAIDGSHVALEVVVDGEFRNAGSYSATAAPADGNYVLTDPEMTLTIARASVVVTINDVSATYGDANSGNPVLTASAALLGDDSAADVYELYVEGLGDKPNAGDYPIKGRASGSAADNYDLIFIGGTYRVARREVTVKINDATVVYSGKAASLDGVGYTADGDYDDLGLVLDAGGATNVGTYGITGAVTNSNYDAVVTGGRLTITPAALTVTLTAPSDAVYDGGAKAVTVAGTSGAVAGEDPEVTIRYTGTTNGGAAYDSLTAPVLAGSYQATALTADGNYAASGSVEYVIARAAVELPAISDGDPLSAEAVADGEMHGVLVGIDLTFVGVRGAGEGTSLTVEEGGVYMRADEPGEYSVTVFLRDTDNYVWADGTNGDVTYTLTLTEPSGLGMAEIVMIVLGCVLAVEAIVLLIYFLTGKGKSKPSGDTDAGSGTGSSDGSGGRAMNCAVPAALPMLAVTAGQSAGIAVLAALCAALLVAEIFLFVRRAKKNSEPAEKADETAATLPETQPAAPEEITEEPAEEPIAETPAEESVEEITETPAEEISEETEEDDEEEIEIVDGRRLRVRYDYSFRAKLIQSSAETQRYYGELAALAAAYPKLKLRESRKQVRVYAGRKTVAVMLFKGRKLCVAYALDPVEYENTKYRLTDMSAVKKYEKTPALLRLTSDRRSRYSKELLDAAAAAAGLTRGEPDYSGDYSLPYRTTAQLVADGLVRRIGESEEQFTEELPAAQPPADEPPAEEPTAEPADEPPAEEPTVEEEDAEAEADETEETDETDDADDSDDEGEEEAVLVGNRRIFVRYDYSFRAKLIQSTAETQRYYGEFMDFVSAYPKVKARESRKQVRVYAGRKTLAVLLFKGKKLCAAFALEPDRAEPKYHVVDMSDRKKYESVPSLLKIFSERKLRYAKELFDKVAFAAKLTRGEPEYSGNYVLPYRTTEELIADGLVRALTSGSGDETDAVIADVAVLVRERITLREARAALSDEAAAAQVIADGPTAGEADEAETGAETPRRTPVRAATRGKRAVLNIDTLSRCFSAGETVTLDAVKAKGLVPQSAEAYKVLARGYIDKPLTVEAQDFSLDAVKMLVLTGGRAVRKNG